MHQRRQGQEGQRYIRSVSVLAVAYIGGRKDRVQRSLRLVIWTSVAGVAGGMEGALQVLLHGRFVSAVFPASTSAHTL